MPRQAPALRAAFRSPLSAFHSARSSRLAPQSAIRNPQSAIPRPALTLIELLVTIVILVTLLAAVLPAVSPNNEGRKVREASRMLVSFFAQAQAQAARDGRPVGVGFSDPETWNDANNNNVRDAGEVTYTGMALEAYIIAEPPAFTGFSTGAAVVCVPPNSSAPDVESDEPPIVNLKFGRGVGGEGTSFTSSDNLPPQMFRGALMADDDNDGESEPEDADGLFEPLGAGDVVEVGQELFELVSNDWDDDDDEDDNPDVIVVNGETYLDSQFVVSARWLSWRGRRNNNGAPILLPQGGKAYRIRRSPMASTSPSRTAAEAIQFPRGIGIDMDPTQGHHVIGIVFSPNGQVDAIYEDGEKNDAEDPFFILLGRVENANPWNGPTATEGVNDIDYTRYDFRGPSEEVPDDDELAERRREVNLFNADSRWVVVSPAGRIVSTENGIFDPRSLVFDPNNLPLGRFVDNLTGSEAEQLEDQRNRFREEAQRYAEQLESDGGG